MILVRNDTCPNTHELAGTFAGLMDLYECNYIGLRRLLPVFPAPGDALISQVPGSLDLHVKVLEHFRYTTELSLTYYFQRHNQSIPEPDLTIRIYHDARMAETMSAQLRHWPAFAASKHTALHHRWHVNRFLYKWLNYCLHQGHRFDTASPDTHSCTAPSTSITQPLPQ